jgi:MFS transporter, DHA2 family, multidrug resistance protein
LPDTPTPTSELPMSTKILIFSVMAFGQFLALTDIQIVAASLNDVQAGLSAGPDEISWVQTGYLMAELVMIPFSGFLGQALSTRGLFVTAVSLFTVSSALCGAAWDIQSMVTFRVIQGFVGGAMVPTVFATAYTLFAGRQIGTAMAILGVVSVMGPTLGPTLGGVLTETVGWRSIFYVNVIPGVVVALVSLKVIRLDAPKPEMLRKIDYAHLASLAGFLGGLEYVLEEGPRNDWLNDPKIAVSAWISFVSFLLFVERSFRSGGPIVKLTPLRRPTFIFACVFNFAIGVGLYSTTYLLPLFLGRVRGYNSLQIGVTVVVTGLAMLATVPVTTKLLPRVDARLLIACGLTLFAGGLWMSSKMTIDWGFGALLGPQILRGVGLMLAIVPSSTIALSGFVPPELRYASGLYALMRNLGGAISIALTTTWLQDWTRVQTARFGEALGEAARRAPDFMVELAGRLGQTTPDQGGALQLARGEFARLVARAALTQAFDQVWLVMAFVFVGALVLVPFCKAPRRPAAAPGPKVDPQPEPVATEAH